MSEILMNTRVYYIAALLIIISAIVIFIVGFERRKPKAREIVILSVMIALAVAGRVVFAMIPQFKPMTAIVIITGISLGRQSGFLCGALSIFISNMFFGQGPWTPWQMFAMGMVGFCAAVICSKVEEHVENSKYRAFMYATGAVLTVAVYGLIMDSANVFMMMDKPGIKALIASYSAGVVFNLIHASATVVFLVILAQPILKKLRRIKNKHGLYNKV